MCLQVEKQKKKVNKTALTPQCNDGVRRREGSIWHEREHKQAQR